uniref:ACT domain-containing protein n=1 Tax=Haemonchus placei TaxID=6290 RepID=A0A0N4W640_HAEPC
LICDNPSADVTLFFRIDRSVGKALAVEKLLQDSYIFDTHVMGRPNGNIHIVAAKRDYI